MTTTPWDDTINAVAAQEGPQVGWSAPAFAALIRAHMKVESNFDPTAYHWDGPNADDNVSRGLMQIEGATAKRLGLPTGYDTDSIRGPGAPRYNVPGRVSGMYDPYRAIPVGARLIRENLLTANGNLDQAIAAYNEGPKHASEDAVGGVYRNQSYVNAVRAALQAEWPADTSMVTSDVAPGDKTILKAAIGIGVLLLGWWLKQRAGR